MNGGTGGGKVRGDIIMVLYGDPGTAKSQFLKYVDKIDPRSCIDQGTGGVGQGLRVYVRWSSITKECTVAVL